MLRWIPLASVYVGQSPYIVWVLFQLRKLHITKTWEKTTSKRGVAVVSWKRASSFNKFNTDKMCLDYIFQAKKRYTIIMFSSANHGELNYKGMVRQPRNCIINNLAFRCIVTKCNMYSTYNIPKGRNPSRTFVTASLGIKKNIQPYWEKLASDPESSKIASFFLSLDASSA